MKKIDLNFSAVSPDGKAVLDGNQKEMNLAVFTGIALMQGTDTAKDDVIKIYDWAHKLYNKEVLSLDRSDFDKFRELIVNMPGMQLLFKGQILSRVGQWV
jgi:hypothetical protein